MIDDYHQAYQQSPVDFATYYSRRVQFDASIAGQLSGDFLTSVKNLNLTQAQLQVLNADLLSNANLITAFNQNPNLVEA